MGESFSGDTKDWPSDWWQRYDYFNEELVRFLGSLLLGMYVSCKIDQKRRGGVYTGFLVEAFNSLLWVTAGHVIDNPRDKSKPGLKQLIEDPKFQNLQFSWMSTIPIPGAEIRGEFLRTLLMESALEKYDLDVGVLIVPPIWSRNLSKPYGVNRLSLAKQHGSGRAEGWCLVGLPKEGYWWLDDPGDFIIDPLRLPTLLPVEPIEYDSAELAGVVPRQPHLLYHRVLPFADDQGSQPSSLRGMSGGLLFSVWRDSDRKSIGYQLVGIQSGEVKSKRIATIEPLSRLRDILKKQAENVKV